VSTRRTKPYIASEIKQAGRTCSVGLIIRQNEANNLQTPCDQVDSFLTPTELCYIGHHFPTPEQDIASYQLRIDGEVGNPF
jgi:DMSO/TMAO reductase YedYZ molybdopterin-dependent catalytic subunit